VSYATPDEARAAFKEMLYDEGISVTLKWNEVLKLCERAPCGRWMALKVTAAVRGLVLWRQRWWSFERIVATVL